MIIEWTFFILLLPPSCVIEITQRGIKFGIIFHLWLSGFQKKKAESRVKTVAGTDDETSMNESRKR